MSEMGRDTQGPVYTQGAPSLVQAPGFVHPGPRVGRVAAHGRLSLRGLLPGLSSHSGVPPSPRSLQRPRKIINGGRLCKHSLSPKLLEM